MAEAERTPSVVVSHLDIVYRVFGSRARTGGSGGLRGLLRGDGRAPRSVHAVKDVSFVAYHGESIGIIGRNGSGKSTLLRAIAGLIPPTAGEVWADGSPALLGVNAVLEKSLSGAKNIYIGAQALGMSRAQVDAVFDEIVEFSELGDFIHLPMSTYSSGMAAKLRFAISTATSPGVLIIDEALATGDAHFRARSHERITELRGRASTVFLVSHSANTVRDMCDRAIWLDGGALVADGPVDEVVDAYEAAGRGSRWSPTDAPEPDVPGVERWFSRDRYTTSALTSSKAFEAGTDRVFLAAGQDLSVALATVPEAVRSAAPVLLVRSRTVPPPTLTELRRLAPAEVVLVGDETAVLPAVEQSLTDAGFTVRRVSGDGPCGTVAALAGGVPLGTPVHLAPHGDETAVLVAALEAVRDDGVVLLTGEHGVPGDVLDAIDTIAPHTVRVLGDADAVPESVVRAVRPLTDGGVQRVLSPSPAEASAQVSATGERTEVDVVYIAKAIGDVVTGAVIAGIAGAPLLLVERDEVPRSVDEELRRLRPAHLVIFGGAGSISPDLRQQLADYVEGSEDSGAETLDGMF